MKDKRKNSDLLCFLLRGELLVHPGRYIGQSLYYLPVMLAVLVLVSTGSISYDNQRTFLRGMKYASILMWDEDSDSDGQALPECGDFRVYEASAASVRESGEDQLLDQIYDVQIFNAAAADIDYELTYFRELDDPGALRLDEAAVSYDAARKLHLGIGDRMLVLSADLSSYQSFTIRQIFRTKYAYGQIGQAGTILLHTDEEVMTDICGAGYWCSFLTSEEGSLLRTVELEETLDRPVTTLQELITNILFPLLGAALFLRIMMREQRQRIKRAGHDTAVCLALGCPMSTLRTAVLAEEALVLALSSILGVLLYDYVFVQLLVGEYFSPHLLVRYIGLLVFAGLLLILLSSRHTENQIRRIDLAAVLSGQ